MAVKTPKPVHLNRYFHFTRAMREADTLISVENWRSRFDGSVNRLFRMKPANARVSEIVIFFHGMDGDCGDAVVLRDLVVAGGVEVICVGGRGPAWVSDAVIADAAQLAHEALKRGLPVSLMGVSMGATQALAVAALLPKKLSRRIQGVLALIPGADLVELARSSSHPRVRGTVRKSAPRTALIRKSPLRLAERYPAGMRFAFFRRAGDRVLPEKGTRELIKELIRRGHPVVHWSEPGDHEFIHADFDFGTFLKEYRMLYNDLGLKKTR